MRLTLAWVDEKGQRIADVHGIRFVFGKHEVLTFEQRDPIRIEHYGLMETAPNGFAQVLTQRGLLRLLANLQRLNRDLEPEQKGEEADA